MGNDFKITPRKVKSTINIFKFIYYVRTDNDIKNHFYSTLRKNIRKYLKDKSFYCKGIKIFKKFSMC